MGRALLSPDLTGDLGRKAADSQNAKALYKIKKLRYFDRLLA